MARARNIKPGFYKNEDLAECSIWARFIFPGLWMLADREGRLEDRPKRIKGELLAFDLVDIEPLLAELSERGFIVRYQNSAGRFIQISKFKTHQRPHYSEKSSAIEPPDFPESVGDDDEPIPEKRTHHEKPIPEQQHRRNALNPDSLSMESRIRKSISSKNGSGLKHTVPVDNSKNQLAQKSNSKPQPDLKAQWWRSHAGIEAAARALHVKPKPGETHVELKQRCFAKIHPKEGHAP